MPDRFVYYFLLHIIGSCRSIIMDQFAQTIMYFFWVILQLVLWRGEQEIESCQLNHQQVGTENLANILSDFFFLKQRCETIRYRGFSSPFLQESLIDRSALNHKHRQFYLTQRLQYDQIWLVCQKPLQNTMRKLRTVWSIQRWPISCKAVILAQHELKLEHFGHWPVLISFCRAQIKTWQLVGNFT